MVSVKRVDGVGVYFFIFLKNAVLEFNRVDINPNPKTAFCNKQIDPGPHPEPAFY